MSLTEARRGPLDAADLRGATLTAALSTQVDAWIRDLFDRQVGERSDIALIAVGGYGRGELAPHSDLDVLLLHTEAIDIAEVADALWYPIWDEGAKLGHAVRTPGEALALAAEDLETATALLSARHLAGSESLVDELAGAAAKQWRKAGKSWIEKLSIATDARHRTNDEVAFMLEPDLKSGRGGLRDVHSLRWAAMARPEAVELDEALLATSYEVLLAARVELHRVADRAGDRLTLERQDAVAKRLDYGDADLLMADVAAAARSIAWHSDEVWTQFLEDVKPRRLRLSRSPVIVGGPGVTVSEGKAELDPSVPVTAESVLRVGAAAAHHDARISPSTITRFDGAVIEVPDPWTSELRTLFVDLFLAGHDAVPIVETLDQLGLFVPFLPEWAPSRSRPQRNRYHRFTVDRHLWEAAAEAAKLVRHVERPDLLVIGALLHDIGKPYPGDHTEVGIELIGNIGRRMGFDAHEVRMLCAMCEHHLLLPDVATRRDLDDEDTIQSVADEVGSVETLQLLWALTEADSIATGPAAWSRWKAGLVRDLASRVTFVLEGGDTTELPRNFPSEEQRQMMRRGTIIVDGVDDVLTVMEIDRPGMFSRVAGAVSLSGLDVLEAAAYTEYGMAIAVFRVEPSHERQVDWKKVTALASAALAGRLAISARLAERVRTYSARAPEANPLRLVTTDVKIDNETSTSATVIEVSAPNGIGLLYQITRALSALDLDISTAKVQTLGTDVVDTFYVLDRSGAKIEDADHMREVDRAIRHAIKLTFVGGEGGDG